jgi:hypothetical protein
MGATQNRWRPTLSGSFDFGSCPSPVIDTFYCLAFIFSLTGLARFVTGHTVLTTLHNDFVVKGIGVTAKVETKVRDRRLRGTSAAWNNQFPAKFHEGE